MNDNTNTRVKIGECRLSYVHVFQPEASANGGEKKYRVSIIIPKSNKKLVAQIKAAMEAAVQAGLPKFGGKRPTNLNMPLRDGDLDRANDENYADSFFINASSLTKPGVVKVMTVNDEKKLVEVSDEDEVYSGCYGYVSVNFFAYSRSGNKGIGAGLNNVLKTKDGDYLGGRSSAQSDFGDMDLSGIGEDENEDDIY